MFTISNESQVSELLKKLLDLGKEINKIDEEVLIYAFKKCFLSNKLDGVMKNIKIAWTSAPFFYIDPIKGMDWLKECLPNYFFFPFQSTSDLEKDEGNECMKFLF